MTVVFATQDWKGHYASLPSPPRRAFRRMRANPFRRSIASRAALISATIFRAVTESDRLPR